MRAKWSTCGALVAALVVVNLLARVGTRIVGGADDVVDFNTGLISLGLMSLLMAVVGFVWQRRDLSGVVAGFLAATIAGASLIVTIVGPYVSQSTPFGAGIVSWLVQLLACAGVLLLGAVIGVLIAIAFGLDPKTRAWREYAQRSAGPRAAKPRAQRSADPKRRDQSKPPAESGGKRRDQSKTSGRK